MPPAKAGDEGDLKGRSGVAGGKEGPSPTRNSRRAMCGRGGDTSPRHSTPPSLCHAAKRSTPMVTPFSTARCTARCFTLSGFAGTSNPCQRQPATKRAQWSSKNTGVPACTSNVSNTPWPVGSSAISREGTDSMRPLTARFMSCPPAGRARQTTRGLLPASPHTPTPDSNPKRCPRPGENTPALACTRSCEWRY